MSLVHDIAEMGIGVSVVVGWLFVAMTLSEPDSAEPTPISEAALAVALRCQLPPDSPGAPQAADAGHPRASEAGC